MDLQKTVGLTAVFCFYRRLMTKMDILPQKKWGQKPLSTELARF